MSYIKLAGQKDKHTSTTMANQISKVKLEEMLGSSSKSDKIKGKIREELAKREKYLAKQKRK